jgi:arylsulfatase A-like enzyme
MTRGPNVLWIVSDHQVHATRPSGFDRFPLQNELARLGIEFSRARTVLPVCSPARASMLTGLYPHAHGLTENDGRFGGREGLDPLDWMIHRPLLDAGYRCGWFGKWHVDNQRSALDYGFEGFSLPGYGYPYASEAYLDYLERKGLAEPVARVEIGGESGIGPGAEIRLADRQTWFDYESGVAMLTGPAEAHEAFFIADLAERWLTDIGDEPFFLRVDTWGPHPPYLLGAPFAGMLDDVRIELPQNFFCDLEDRPQHHRDYRDYWRKTLDLDRAHWRQMYQRALEHAIQVETALCVLLDRVDLQNTLVVFNSDHGDAVGSNGAVANKGGLMTEATMQIPLLMAGAGMPAGSVRDQLVSSLDLVPTLADLCGVESRREFHGANLLPLIENPGAAWREGLLAQHYGLHERIVQRAWYQQDWKLILQPDGFEELYQLSDDPGETSNLAAGERCRERAAAMSRALYAAMDAVGDSDLPRRIAIPG